MPSKRTRDTVAILREHGPLTIEELGRRLAELGSTRARDPVPSARAAVAREPRAFQLRDGRWLDRVAALDGAVLLHRVAAFERRRAAIRMDPDLSVLSGLVGRPEPWRTAPLPGVIELGWVRDRRLDRRHAAPDRLLAIPFPLARSLRPGDMVQTIVTDGALEFELVRDARTAEDLAYHALEALACEVFGAPSADDCPATIDTLLLELVGRVPGSLRSLREPVGAMLHRVGLATHRERVGPPTTEWHRREHLEAALEMAVAEAWRDEPRLRDEPPPHDVSPGPDDWFDRWPG